MRRKAGVAGDNCRLRPCKPPKHGGRELGDLAIPTPSEHLGSCELGTAFIIRKARHERIASGSLLRFIGFARGGIHNMERQHFPRVNVAKSPDTLEFGSSTAVAVATG